MHVYVRKLIQKYMIRKINIYKTIWQYIMKREKYTISKSLNIPLHLKTSYI